MEDTESRRKTGAAVSCKSGTKRASDIRARWSWVEPAVWTDRMLSALEKGVKGGVWFSLIDKVYRRENLESATRRVISNKGGPGVDGVTVKRFGQYRERYLEKLEGRLRSGAWRPKAIKRHYIPKPGKAEKRPLGIPCVEDRVVQTALRNVIEPVFEKTFHENSFGFRPGRGCQDALHVVGELLESGAVYVVDADLRKFFDTIEHDLLLERVEEKIADSRVLRLIKRFLNQRILDGVKAWSPERGTPQGAVISPLLANIFLNPLDHLMAEHGQQMIRYADDSVILCRSEEQAQDALALMRQWCEENGLELHPEKTHIANLNEAGEGFDFLGYRFQRTRRGKLDRWAGKKACKNLRARIRPIVKRCNGHGMETLAKRLSPILRGWFEYFKHSNIWAMKEIDGWVRMRLRSILRKRHKGKGRGRGKDHNKWPNHYFRELGLYSLEQAWVALGESFR